MSADKYVNCDISTGTTEYFHMIISYATKGQGQEEEEEWPQDCAAQLKFLYQNKIMKLYLKF